jgi:acetyl-CoA carboxylase biotin carboxylase subunit
MEAIDRMNYALDNFVIKGIDTVIPFLLLVLKREEYKRGDVHTKWLERVLEETYPEREV